MPESFRHTNSDIVDYLDKAGVERGRVSIFQSFAEFNAEYVTPRLLVLDALRDGIMARTERRFNVDAWIAAGLPELLNDENWGCSILGLDFISCHVSQCSAPESVSIDDVRELPSGDVLLSLSCSLPIEVAASYEGSDYDRHFSEMCDVFGEPEEPFGSMTSWVTEDVHVEISLILAHDTLNVKSAQVDGLEGRDGLVEVRTHPAR